MASSHTQILVADAPSPWRTALVEGLEAVEPAIRVTEYGQELRRALEEVKAPPRVIVFGPELMGVGGLEALFLAERSLVLEKKKRPDWTVRTVSLITDVRSDAELLDLFRRRGVTHFCYRADPVERTVAALLANMRRPASRAPVRIEAVLSVGKQRAEAAVYDLSVTGARVVVAAADLRKVPPIGEPACIEMFFRSRTFECKAEVRRLSAHLGGNEGRLLLGLQFLPMKATDRRMLEDLLSDAVEELEVAQEGTSPGRF